MRKCPACGGEYADDVGFCPGDATRLGESAPSVLGGEVPVRGWTSAMAAVTPEPAVPIASATVETPAPVVEAPSPFVEPPAEIVEAATPLGEAAAPVVAAAEIISSVEAPAPVAEATAPVVDDPEPVSGARQAILLISVALGTALLVLGIYYFFARP